ncbi:MAG: flagellar M-ring protein FliF, partial [Spirochaetes bacterium GWD1_61_31]
MNAIKEFFNRIKTAWTSWGLPQKLILIGVALALIIAAVVLIGVSRTPTMVRLINTPIQDGEELRRITSRLDRENIAFSVGEGNVLYVKNEQVRTDAISILMREDLIPEGTSLWSVFAIDRFTVTDFERNVNLRQAIIQEVTRHIEAIEAIDKANVILEMPEETLFAAEQKPITASVILYPRPGSDIATNRQQLEGIQKIILFAVSGLTPENIVITDQNGIILNDFAGMEDFDRLERTRREQQLIQRIEAQYRAAVLTAL